jgi:hypothetical protein
LETLQLRIQELERSVSALRNMSEEARRYADKVHAIGEAVLDGEMEFDEFLSALADE